MSSPSPPEGRDHWRELLFFQTPQLWPHWPFLPLIRRRPDGALDYGVLYDLRGTTGQCGYSATVFLTILHLMPSTLSAFLALPREVFDTPEEILRAGWRVD